MASNSFNNDDQTDAQLELNGILNGIDTEFLRSLELSSLPDSYMSDPSIFHPHTAVEGVGTLVSGALLLCSCPSLL